MRKYFTERRWALLCATLRYMVEWRQLFGDCADRDNERRGVPAAANVGRHDGEVGRRLHDTSSLSLVARALLHSVPRLRTDCLRRTSRAVSCRQPLAHRIEYDTIQCIIHV